jgi:hypothetical protein
MPFDGVGSSEVTERLIIGRARIEAGWCQGKMHRHRWTMRGRRHEYCLVGALRGAPTADPVPNMALRLVIRTIFHLGYGWMQPAAFNDTHTKAQVLDVLDVAIVMSQRRISRDFLKP